MQNFASVRNFVQKINFAFLILHRLLYVSVFVCVCVWCLCVCVHVRDSLKIHSKSLRAKNRYPSD